MVRTRAHSYGEIPDNSRPIERQRPRAETGGEDNAAAALPTTLPTADPTQTPPLTPPATDPTGTIKPKSKSRDATVPANKEVDASVIDLDLNIGDLYKFTKELKIYEQSKYEEWLAFRSKLEAFIVKVALASNSSVTLNKILSPNTYLSKKVLELEARATLTMKASSLERNESHSSYLNCS